MHCPARFKDQACIASARVYDSEYVPLNFILFKVLAILYHDTFTIFFT